MTAALGHVVCIHCRVNPNPQATQVERDADDVADHGQVEIRSNHLGSDHGGEEEQTSCGSAGIDVAKPRNDGKQRRDHWIGKPNRPGAARRRDDLALDCLGAELRPAVGTEGCLLQ